LIAVSTKIVAFSAENFGVAGWLLFAYVNYYCLLIAYYVSFFNAILLADFFNAYRETIDTCHDAVAIYFTNDP
jgi:hypothetical protein